MQILIKIMIAVMALVMLFALSPALSEISKGLEGCDSFNCQGYVDADRTSDIGDCSSADRSYNSTFAENTLGCTIRPILVPMVVLLLLVGVIGWVLYSREEPMGAGISAGYAPGY